MLNGKQIHYINSETIYSFSDNLLFEVPEIDPSSIQADWANQGQHNGIISWNTLE